MHAFARLLGDEGVTRGLIGPREVPRLWDRHLLNCAAVADLLPPSGTVIDVGSGGGLPGVVLAVMRPELTFVLLESMERRVTWLSHVVEELGLRNVEVDRGRAEESSRSGSADVVTARAVAPMDRLAGWTLPLLRHGGVLLAMKGQSAQAELDAAAPAISRLGGDAGVVIEVTSISGVEPTTVVRVEKVGAGTEAGARSTPGARRTKPPSARRRRG
ncbi:MAG: 16S rRNA (guanine(527)-N(7))-methyltransferase RsmG [Cellulomonadaceae bacterium]|nr:16S rRNA (guanine(527)-N(7))-methyltransferase RsmG [Cellulomonadaceae bacterium]